MSWVDAKIDYAASDIPTAAPLNVVGEDLRILGGELVLSGSGVGWGTFHYLAGTTRGLQNTIYTVGANSRIVLRRASANFKGSGSGKTWLRLIVGGVTAYTATANMIDVESGISLYNNATAGAVQVAVQVCVYNAGTVPAWTERYDGWCVQLTTEALP